MNLYSLAILAILNGSPSYKCRIPWTEVDLIRPAVNLGVTTVYERQGFVIQEHPTKDEFGWISFSKGDKTISYPFVCK